MKKQALLVGINDYPGHNSDLRGCINDVTNVRNVLRTFFGFTNEQIRVLTDFRATKENILFRLEKMVAQAKPGDFLVFHFSGHGSQIRDRNEDELNDYMDELFCPYDMNWDNGFITDDMLREILNKLKQGVHMEIILDCCHSGTGTRETDFGRPPELGPENPVLNRMLLPPVDIESRHQGEEEKLKPKKAFKTDNDIILNHVLWAGCRDDQTSADASIGGCYNGAFSYYFCKHIRENGGNINRDELHSGIFNSLGYNRFSQVPQLECQDNLKSQNIFSLPNRSVKK